MIILGLSGGFHPGSGDAAATLFIDGKVVAAVEEERLTRVKHSIARPPARCIQACLDIAGITIHDVDKIALYLETYSEFEREMTEHFNYHFGYCPEMFCFGHHETHAASCFFSSGFSEAAAVCVDYSGDGIASSIWKCSGEGIDLVRKIDRPNSLGVFYSVFTQFLGFERGDEFKMMGLSAYGEPNINLDRFIKITGEAYEVNPDILNPYNRSVYQNVADSLLYRWRPELARPVHGKVGKKHMDLAASVQAYYEQGFLSLLKTAKELTGADNVCLAGGCILNCKANGRALSEKIFDQVYVPPFPNDTGTSYGAGTLLSIQTGRNIDPLGTTFLGPGFRNDQIKNDLDLLGCTYREVESVEDVVAECLCRGQLVGWHQGRMEVGPRALGARSILADPRDNSSRDRINKYVKFRETFRPFAPSVLEDECIKWFDIDQPSPYMSFAVKSLHPDQLPAVTHVDRTSRVQSVKSDDSVYARLLQSMKKKTGIGCVLNTSFNYMGQPIVCTPKEAVYTFFGTGLNMLAIGNFILEK